MKKFLVGILVGILLVGIAHANPLVSLSREVIDLLRLIHEDVHVHARYATSFMSRQGKGPILVPEHWNE